MCSQKNVSGFNLISKDIEECFKGSGSILNKQEVERRRNFLNGKIVKAWCDCSDNFEHKKLINNFEKFVRGI